MDMKISDITSVSSAAVTKKTEKASSEEFSFTLNKVSDDKLMERLNSLMEDIAAQGKKLGEHMDIRDMKKYRSLVTDFINEVVTNSHEFSRENFLDRRGRHRVYGIVKLVNKGLDDLAQELLKKEKDHIAILDKTDEIQGLLMDIMI
ncbi:MAG: YaaR family protein [Firmicutes bacterium]|nr:YaaR family protein [Bacillota bacterium]